MDNSYLSNYIHKPIPCYTVLYSEVERNKNISTTRKIINNSILLSYIDSLYRYNSLSCVLHIIIITCFPFLARSRACNKHFSA